MPGNNTDSKSSAAAKNNSASKNKRGKREYMPKAMGEKIGGKGNIRKNRD